jgi:AraC-like DNA-binding protein
VCELLHDPEWPLVVIAAECGFADQRHFTRVFRKLTGTTPAQFRFDDFGLSDKTRGAEKGDPQ